MRKRPADRELVQRRPRFGVSVVAVSLCVAVAGAFGAAGSSASASAAAAPAPWHVVPSPSPANPTNVLRAASCANRGFCVAVGYTVSPSSDVHSLIESWDGTSWSVSPGSDPAGAQVALDGVSCVSQSSCVAVGYLSSGAVQQAASEIWNGTTWSAMSTPSPGGNDNLAAVSCVTRSACVAVGTTEDPSTDTLVESWNGNTWAVEASSNPGNALNELDGVSCASASYCVGVGRQVSGSSAQPLIETGVGASWTTDPTPGLGVTGALQAVACPRVSDCTAVGYDSNGPGDTLVEDWNGQNWTVSPSPSPSSFGPNGLFGVSCVSTSSCVAVGEALGTAPNGAPSGSAPQVLVETWNGDGWSVTSSANPATFSSALLGISCADEFSCTAVGYYEGAGQQTLVESDQGSHVGGQGKPARS